MSWERGFAGARGASAVTRKEHFSTVKLKYWPILTERDDGFVVGFSFSWRDSRKRLLNFRVTTVLREETGLTLSLFSPSHFPVHVLKAA